ncbi:MAG: PIG-L family deacetylase [Proteobacteria bacterium]|nr:MAG: PIG-L family deacetylase [Pseudomonadota bacterium]
MKAKAYRLLVVAHPDDETIFFGGLLMRKRSVPWKVICVTDGNADGRGKERAAEFLAATKLLGAAKAEQWNFPDRFPARLPIDQIEAKLAELAAPKEIYTHGPLGEYGHPHHQDISLAVHRAFPRVPIFSPAHNTRPDRVVKMSPSEYKKKTRAFAQIYKKETENFIGFLPNNAIEGFTRFRASEVEAIVGYLREERELDPEALERHQWMAEMLPRVKGKFGVRV